MSARNCSCSNALQRDSLARRRLLAGRSAGAAARVTPWMEFERRTFEGFFNVRSDRW